MKVKNRIILIIAIVLVLGLAACGSGQQAEPNTATDSKTIQESGTEPATAVHSEDATSEPEVTNETESKSEETMH